MNKEKIIDINPFTKNLSVKGIYPKHNINYYYDLKENYIYSGEKILHEFYNINDEIENELIHKLEELINTYYKNVQKNRRSPNFNRLNYKKMVITSEKQFYFIKNIIDDAYKYYKTANKYPVVSINENVIFILPGKRIIINTAVNEKYWIFNILKY